MATNVKIARPLIGLRRIHSNQSAATAGATQSVRTEMQTIVDNMQKLMDGVTQATPEALDYALRPIYDASQELVPVDKGKLKESGYLETRRNGEMVEAELGYGKGNNPSYAVFVHEDLEATHNFPTSAKFLEKPLKAQWDEVGARIRDYLSGLFN
jgi:hypothetical protein